MSADAVLEDALREAGYAHVAAWHLRCVEAWRAGGALSSRDGARVDLRLIYELRSTADDVHFDALLEHQSRENEADFNRRAQGLGMQFFGPR